MNFVLVTRVGQRDLLHPREYEEKLPGKVRLFHNDYLHDCTPTCNKLNGQRLAILRY